MSIVPFHKNHSSVDSDVVRFFERHPLLDKVGSNELLGLVRHARPVKLARRSALWEPGAEAVGVYFVRSGVVRINQITANDRELTLHLLGRRQVFGEEALSVSTRSTQAHAHEDVTLYHIDAEVVQRFLERQPNVALGLLSYLAKRKQDLDARLASVAYMTARARVAAVLLELSRSFGVQDSRGTIVNIRLTHRELAALIGATRETVSFAVLAFRRAGIIETEHKRVVILEREALEREAREDTN